MKRLFLLFSIFCMTGCYAEELKLTRIIPALNLFVFDDAYIVGFTKPVPDLKEGDMFEIDLDSFHTKTTWKQYVMMDEEKGLCIRYGLIAFGVLGKESMNLEEFSVSAMKIPPDAYVKDFLHCSWEKGWFTAKPETQVCNYKDWGVDVTVFGVIGEFNRLAPKYAHEIYWICSNLDPEATSGFLTTSSKDTLFNKKHFDALVLFSGYKQQEQE